MFAKLRLLPEITIIWRPSDYLAASIECGILNPHITVKSDLLFILMSGKDGCSSETNAFWTFRAIEYRRITFCNVTQYRSLQLLYEPS